VLGGRNASDPGDEAPSELQRSGHPTPNQPPRITGDTSPDPRLDSRQAEALNDLSVRRSFTVTYDRAIADHQNSGFRLSHIGSTN
jgi:hypothetical protein